MENVIGVIKNAIKKHVNKFWEGNILAKPSIFSRDYERKMKKRKRRVILTVVIISIIVIFAGFKFIISDLDFSNVRAKLQAWVDSGKSQEDLDKEALVDNKDKNNKEDIKKSETTIASAETNVAKVKELELKISDKVTLKASYEEKNGKKQFTNIEKKEGYDFDISPSKEKVIVSTPTQDLKLFNVDGSEKEITKKVHTSTKGTQFLKDNILEQMPDFIWCEQAKFIDDKMVVYISEMPYFGSGLTDKYIWIKNTENFESPENPNDTQIYGVVGTDVKVGNIKDKKGIEITVDGNVYYVNSNGEISN